MELAGNDCKASTSGMFLVTTNSKSPYAKGRLYDDDARELKWNRDELNIRDALEARLENGNFTENLSDSDKILLMEVLGLSNKFVPTVSVIKGDGE